ncbi:DUF6789 family protein [Halobellus sp. GM3]|uniref:DUF6789 family protein n=1 Tax=Halobellus sp. GM3 TaxID=3458410 RepID=UPI00403E1483
MNSELSETPPEITEREHPDATELLITPRIVLTAMGAGLVGTVAMLPVLVGIPALLGVFRVEPVVRFAGFAEFFGLEPTVVLGVGLFLFGGTVVLPLTFLVVGAFLPPENPRYLRGVTFSTAFWLGFLPGLWPSGDLATVIAFVLFSLAGHWIYGLVLGFGLSRTIGIPQHQV